MAGKFQRGSEWRKWDLYVHSPYSVLGSDYPGTEFEEKWNSFLDALERVDDVAVLGITDYFSVEGYNAHKQISIADVISLKILKRVRAKLTQIGQLENARILISEALQDMGRC